MRKKNAGALFMDFEISPEDRIGGASTKRGRAKAPAKAKTRAAKPTKGERVEPGFGGGFFSSDEVYADEPPRRGRAPKQKKAPRGKKQRRGFSMWRLFGRLFYWALTLGVVGAICLAGVVYYYWMQMPAVSTLLPASEWVPATSRPFIGRGRGEQLGAAGGPGCGRRRGRARRH